MSNVFNNRCRKHSGYNTERGSMSGFTVPKITGSIPDGVVRNFPWHNPSGRTMALGLIQPLTEMSTRSFSWVVKAAGAQGWQYYHNHVPTSWKFGNVSLLKTSGPV